MEGQLLPVFKGFVQNILRSKSISALRYQNKWIGAGAVSGEWVRGEGFRWRNSFSTGILFVIYTNESKSRAIHQYDIAHDRMSKGLRKVFPEKFVFKLLHFIPLVFSIEKHIP